MTSQFPGGEMPGMAAMNDTLAFVKKLWGGMQVPGMITPTVSVDDLDKKIKDLKTVESWLNVNMNMLRGTIQALEVQRATIATLNSLGASFSSAMAAAPAAEASPFSSSATTGSAPPASNPGWPMPPAATAARAATAAPPQDTAPEPERAAAAEDDDEEAEAGETDTTEAAASSQFVNPAAWWTLLQDQFKHAVNNAMAGELTGKQAQEKTAKVAPAAKKTAVKPAAKSAAKSPAKSGGAPKKAAAGKSTAAKRARAKPVPAASDKHATPKA